MGFDLKKLHKATGETEIEIMDGEKIKIEYRRGVITAPWIDALQDALTGQASATSTLEKAAELVVGWDLTEGEKPLPLPTEKERKALTDAELKLAEVAPSDKKAHEEAHSEYVHAREKILSSFSKLEFSWVVKMMRACATDASLGDQADLKTG